MVIHGFLWLSMVFQLKEQQHGATITDHIPGHLQMVYTCKVHGNCSAQQFSKQVYHRGAVVVRCLGCQSLYLIADNLGCFSKGKTYITIATEVLFLSVHYRNTDCA